MTEDRAGDGLLPTTVRLTGAAEALAALAAHVRVETEGLDVDERVRSLLAAIATELTGSADVGADAPGPQAVGMARAFLRESAALVDDPGRLGDWANVDEAVLQGLGRLSMAIAPVFAHAAATLPGLGDALAAPGAAVLDVGTGTGWLAIATARAFPAARVLGIDVFEPALALARRNVDAEQLADRVSLRLLDVGALDEAGAYDLVWLPLPFLPRAVVGEALRRSHGALRPGGWVLPGTFAGPDDRLSQLLVDLRIVRSGGHPWETGELLTLMAEAGFDRPHEVERAWPAPLRLFAGRRRP
jgi:SAM-dependent methyltransferase